MSSGTKIIQAAAGNAGAPAIEATGGTVTEANVGGQDYKIHRFNSSGTFSVTSVPEGATVEYIIVAGGGTGFGPGGGGGGGGGYFSSVSGEPSGGGTPARAAFAPTVTDYTITIGGAATASSALGFSTSGGGNGNPFAPGGAGGSGGGGDQPNRPGGAGTSGQGFPGGAGAGYPGTTGGGGGASGAGANGANVPVVGGGAGVTTAITGTPSGFSNGGLGWYQQFPIYTPSPGGANTGNGGSSGNNQSAQAAIGGSGCVIIRYPI